MTTTINTKLHALESMRGIAAISVAIYHCRIGIFSDVAFINNAWMMVDFFFVLSGFVIALNYQNSLKSFRGLYNFQLKRFFRLYPLHILTLFIFLIIEIAKYFIEIKFGISSIKAFTSNNTYSFISNLFLVQNFTSKDLTWNYVSWSISAEFYTYFLFAIILVACLANKRLFMAATAFISFFSMAALIYLRLSGSYDSIYSGALRCFYSFFLGVLAFNIFVYLKKRIVFTSSLIALISIIMSISAISVFGEKSSILGLLSSYLFALTIIVVSLSNKEAIILKILHNKQLINLGTVSYGIYMIHPIVWFFMQQTSTLIFDYPITIGKDSSNTTSASILFETLFVIMGLLITVCLSKLSFRFIETRSNNFHYKFLKK